MCVCVCVHILIFSTTMLVVAAATVQNMTMGRASCRGHLLPTSDKLFWPFLSGTAPISRSEKMNFVTLIMKWNGSDHESVLHQSRLVDLF